MLSPPPPDLDAVTRYVRASVAIGDTRTMQQDVSYGLRQLADVALKALSPGINDPTTAQDAIFHTAAVLAELLKRDPPPHDQTDDTGTWLIMAQQPTCDELVELAFDETRRAASAQPTVCIYLLEALALFREVLVTAGRADRTAAITAQARLVVAGCERSDLVPADVEVVRGGLRQEVPSARRVTAGPFALLRQRIDRRARRRPVR